MNSIICSGALFYTLDTQRFLFLHRTQSKQPNVWGLVGGTNETEEIPYQALLREIKEEIGFVPKIIKIHPLDIYQSNDGHFMYHTFVIVTPTEFEPNINHESQDYCWSKLRKLPRPLHQGARKTLLDKNNVKKLNLIVNSID